MSLQKTDFTSLYLELIKEPIFYLDEKLHIIKTNQAGKELFMGKGEDDNIFNRPCIEVCLFKDNDENCICPSVEAKASQKPQFEELTTAKGDTWLIKSHPLYNKQNEIKGYVEILTDQTTYKKMEQELHTNKKRLKSTIATSHDAIWEVDLEGRILYQSSRVEEFLGYKPEEFVGLKLYETGIYQPKESIRIKKTWVDILESKQPFEGIETEATHKNGETKHFESSGTPLFNKADEIIGYRMAHRDITKQKRDKELQRKSYLQIENNIMNFATLIDGIRNPLAVIIGSAELIDSPLSEKIVDNALSISEITNNISKSWQDSEQIRLILQKQLFEID